MIEIGKPPFLLMPLANADCGWHRAVQYNSTGFGYNAANVVISAVFDDRKWPVSPPLNELM